ncbi:bifunctional proline dehydrogenase/L-glutamate gamma-semialdehyde dehydrogenase PutA [Arenicella sp. 4NH20-0111]|uniref:bifunctional proline dehydrogenase/L-glutamate gamma-semialdehyde dehydrogenase PutA n=1 Tax=Arenicella sp. 4NH20-0111 TaxID=3127648 RepID=UPI00310A3C27
MNTIDLNALRQEILASKHADEHTFVEGLLATPALNEATRLRIEKQSTSLVETCRSDTKSQTLLDSFLQEYGLSNQEGVALMCLAEALLRVPDRLTADRLIAEKLGSRDWLRHAGESDSWLVNASTWGLVLTGKLVELDSRITQSPSNWLKRLVTKLSEPIVHIAVLQAMKLMGGQYVLGRSIDEGISQGRKQNKHDEVRFSFDMLGEGARTHADADRYYHAYSDAFDRVGELNIADSVINAHGVSVKLSALHPQYHFAHAQTVTNELLPKITALCIKAKKYNIGLSIDAEESERLELSLDIFQALCENPELSNWRGLGFVMQAYQKRAPALAKWLISLAQTNNRTIMVRLVKGAYWDAEIKHAQEQGFSDYPVFTRKVNTDICYIECAKILLSGAQNVYPQFATHNAHTAVAIANLANQLGVSEFEFQRLHGMGELLYKHLPNVDGLDVSPLRIYAPIGKHRDLLPYLVRRLLENGANSSFVNRFLDSSYSASELVADCYDTGAKYKHYRHDKIPTPDHIFLSPTSSRLNSKGFDLDDAQVVARINTSIEDVLAKELLGHSIIDGKAILSEGRVSVNPSDLNNPTGTFHEASVADVESAIDIAHQGSKSWANTPVAKRTEILNKAADILEKHSFELIGLISREAGRTIADCVSEIREAVDFCRYYSEQAIQNPNRTAQGIYFCISPWNFPVAIFSGQIAAALATGNSVLAKPADPTPIIATRVTQLFHLAGIPTDALQLLIGDGPTIGATILPDPRLAGVAFTGSTTVAQTIGKQLALRDGPSIPFIAETGGQNCMVVDSTALPEQVVDDVIASAFHSAGQRCSALRVLYLQDVIADSVLDMLEGALALLHVGSPKHLSTDVGPIIDRTALARLDTHASYIEPLSSRSMKAPESKDAPQGHYFMPRVYEIDSIKSLEKEVFGPILHVIRYKMSNLDSVIQEINSTGYGLTFGVHSRISAFADHLFNTTNAGNTYINRNTIGAVVGVNPFGGRGLSGTGPKAGGPSYLNRFTQASESGSSLNVDELIQAASETPTLSLQGPTGESNQLISVPIGDVLFVLDTQTPLKELTHICNLTLALGNTVTFTIRNIANKAQHDALLTNIPDEYHPQIRFNEENVLARVSNKAHQAIVIHASHPQLLEFRTRVANRVGAITQLIEFDETVLLRENLTWYSSMLSSERTKTDNLVAKGGNTQLFNLDEENS